MSTGGLKVFSKEHSNPITFEELKVQIDDWNKQRYIEMKENVVSKIDIEKPIEYGKLENVGVAYSEERLDVIKHSQAKPEIDFGIFE